MRYSVTLADRTYEVELTDSGLLVDGEAVAAVLTSVPGTPVHGLRMGLESHRIIAERDRTGVWVMELDGRPVQAEVVDERTRRLREMVRASVGADGPRALKAPMPGLVVRVEVAEGDEVATGQGLVIVEAMKMENELKAPCAARVSRIRIVAGDTVEKDQILIELASVGSEVDR